MRKIFINLSSFLNRTKLISTLTLFLINTSIFSQENINAFYIGHSLSDQIPDMVKSLANDDNDANFDWVYQSIPGAPLSWQWERKDADDYTSIPPHYYGFYDTNYGLPAGNFDVLVLTESVPRFLSIINLTHQYADSFFVYANTYNANLKIYLYEDWHCILSGTPTGCDYDIDSNPWRQRLEDDLPMWESVVDTLNNKFNPNHPVCLIPAGQGLANVYDSIYAGVMPGLSQIEDLFSDNIHLNDIGKYFVACVHFATLFEKSPVGLTNQLQVWWGGDFDAPSPELALKFQEIAWFTAVNYPNSCFNQTSNVLELNNKTNITIFPNPSSTEIYIETDQEIEEILIYNVYGQFIERSFERKISVENYPNGIYFIQINDTVIKFIKE